MNCRTCNDQGTVTSEGMPGIILTCPVCPPPKIYFTTDGSTPTEQSQVYDPEWLSGVQPEIQAAVKESWLQCRSNSMIEVDALLLAGWSFELPELINGWKMDTEPWQWYWRSPPKRAGKKGRKYWSTTQAYNALKRMTP